MCLQTKPQFGVAEDELSAMYRGGIIPYGEPFTQLWSKLKANVQQVVNSKHTHNLSMLLHGASGSGKSAIAAKVRPGRGVQSPTRNTQHKQTVPSHAFLAVRSWHQSATFRLSSALAPTH